ncbi:asparagine synthase-related protein [Devosia sp.]|uniref:asparagine synthase-related protein n=1 Tax=Devosia sp. TaxID=1871048 RepID=UPI00345C3F00
MSSASVARDKVHEVLAATCRKLLVSDVPVGLMLSSGIDSGILSALVPGDNVPAFTARFESSTFDEGKGAEHLARFGGHQWHSLFVDRQSDIVEDFRSVALAVDGELADSSALAHFMICRAIRQHVTVAISGDGADEFFGGYDTYLATTLAERLGWGVVRGPAGLASALATRVSAGHEGRTGPLQFLARFGAGIAAPEGAYHAEWRRITPRSLVKDLYGPALVPVLGADPLAAYRHAYNAANGEVLDRALLADQTHYLPADMLTKVDRMSMAHGLEVRVPFLERPVMELAGDLASGLLIAREKEGGVARLGALPGYGSSPGEAKEARI